MTPGQEAAVLAISQSLGWGYSVALGFVVLVLLTSRHRGGE